MIGINDGSAPRGICAWMGPARFTFTDPAPTRQEALLPVKIPQSSLLRADQDFSHHPDRACQSTSDLPRPGSLHPIQFSQGPEQARRFWLARPEAEHWGLPKLCEDLRWKRYLGDWSRGRPADPLGSVRPLRALSARLGRAVPGEASGCYPLMSYWLSCPRRRSSFESRKFHEAGGSLEAAAASTIPALSNLLQR